MQSAGKPSQMSRSELYALRRDMILRLQQATRGMPRRDRFRTQRAFAEAWDDLAGRGELGILAKLMHHDHPRDICGIPFVLESLAAGYLVSGHDRGAVPSGCAALAGENEVTRVSPRAPGEGRPSGPSAAPVWWDRGQGDLFSGGLLAQPL